MYNLNISKAIKKMSVNDMTEFVFENYYKRIGFSKEDSYYSVKRLKRKDLLLLANKLIEKVSDLCKAKEHYESFLRKKNRKSVKQPEVIAYRPKTFGTVDIKSDVTEHPKTSRKLSKTIKKDEKIGSNGPLYSDTKKRANFLSEKRYENNKTRTYF